MIIIILKKIHKEFTLVIHKYTVHLADDTNGMRNTFQYTASHWIIHTLVSHSHMCGCGYYKSRSMAPSNAPNTSIDWLNSDRNITQNKSHEKNHKTQKRDNQKAYKRWARECSLCIDVCVRARKCVSFHFVLPFPHVARKKFSDQFIGI